MPGKTLYELLAAAPATNNQLTGFGYDVAGNMTSNGGATYTYDAEGHMTKFVGGSTNNYSYDGDGQRVKKSGTVMLYWYGATGEVLDETNGSGTLTSEYVFFNGKRVARRDADNSVHYYFSDHLGSASAVTSSTGTITAESDYYPYGGEVVVTSGDANRYKFTGKERDSESGLDNFGFRYDSSAMGRFMTPDPSRLSVFFANPQTWNRYSYVYNNPLRLTDGNGKWPTDIHNQIIDNSFPNLTAAQRQILKNISAQQDSILMGGQGNSMSSNMQCEAPIRPSNRHKISLTTLCLARRLAPRRRSGRSG